MMKVILMYQKDLNMGYLLDFYGEAIPQKHKEIMSLYYEEDMSLSEIAESFGMSRQGARHLIKKGEEQLLFLEDKLGLAKRHKDATRDYAEFCQMMLQLKDELYQVEDNERLLQLFDTVLLLSEKLNLD